MSDAANAYRILATVWSGYLEGRASFAEVEDSLAVATRAEPDPNVQELFKSLYHLVNHYEADADLRAEDPDYAAAMLTKLRRIASSLSSGSSADVQKAIDAFWRR